jgi:hypothetical protein
MEDTGKSKRFSIGEYVVYKHGEEIVIAQVKDTLNGYTLSTNMGQVNIKETAILTRAYTLTQLSNNLQTIERNLGKSILSV